MATPGGQTTSIERAHTGALSDGAASAVRNAQTASTAPAWPPNALALGAIVLWSTLAWLALRLASMPPFLLAGSALTIAGLLASPTWRRWRVAPRVLAVGVYGLFGFHSLLFVALALAPPASANIVNYLWPLLMVLLAPVFLDGVRLGGTHAMGGMLGLAGAITAIAGGRASETASTTTPHAALGYCAALVSATVWATYSLLGRRLRERGFVVPTAAIGASCLASGALALGCHALFEAPYLWRGDEWPALLALAIGPMGGAFFLWDAALARGDARTIGTLAYLTPVLSTMLLGAADPSRFGWPIVAAVALVVGGAAVGTTVGAAVGARPIRRAGRDRPRP